MFPRPGHGRMLLARLVGLPWKVQGVACGPAGAGLGWERFQAPYVPNAHFSDGDTEAQGVSVCPRPQAGSEWKRPNSPWSAGSPPPRPPSSPFRLTRRLHRTGSEWCGGQSKVTPHTEWSMRSEGRWPLAHPPPLPLRAPTQVGASGSCFLSFLRLGASPRRESFRERKRRKTPRPSQPGRPWRCLARGGHRGEANSAHEPPAPPHCGGGAGGTWRPAPPPRTPLPRLPTFSARTLQPPGGPGVHARSPRWLPHPPRPPSRGQPGRGPGVPGTPPAGLTRQARRA